MNIEHMFVVINDYLKLIIFSDVPDTLGAYCSRCKGNTETQTGAQVPTSYLQKWGNRNGSHKD